MLDRTPRWPLAIALLGVAPILVPAPALAQQQGQEDESPARLVAVTTFAIPYQDRARVWAFMRDYFLPSIQLNPKVINLRVMTHLYGSGGAEVIIMREVADWADIQAPCGTPCEEYQRNHPMPEEGSPAWAEFAAARELFQKYYSDHRDDIYSVVRAATKIEGLIVGTVGRPAGEVATGGGGE